jgi:hypothetical protein
MSISRVSVASLVALTACVIPGLGGGGGDPMRQNPYAGKVLPAVAPAAVSFPEADGMLPESAKEWQDLAKGSLHVQRIYLVDSDWDINRNPNTGIIIDRKARVSIFYHGSSGHGMGQVGPDEDPNKCYEKSACVLYQKDEGGNHWSKPFLTCPSEYAKEHKCDEVDALRGSPPA